MIFALVRMKEYLKSVGVVEAESGSSESDSGESTQTREQETSRENAPLVIEQAPEGVKMVSAILLFSCVLTVY